MALSIGRHVRASPGRIFFELFRRATHLDTTCNSSKIHAQLRDEFLPGAYDVRTVFESYVIYRRTPEAITWGPWAGRRLLSSSATCLRDAPTDDQAKAETAAGRGEAAEEEAKPRDERTQILEAALNHVNRLGWTEAALAEGAQDLDLSPSVLGIFPRKEAELVEYFMDDCKRRLEEEVAHRQEEFEQMTVRERMVAAIRERLELQALLVSSWPQALSIQARPTNVPTSFRQRSELLEVLWRASGDHAADVELYVKKLLLAGAYSTSEIYMLTDFSPGFEDTWKFLERQVEGVLELKKTAQEATHLAKAVGAGLQKTINSVLQGKPPGRV